MISRFQGNIDRTRTPGVPQQYEGRDSLRDTWVSLSDIQKGWSSYWIMNTLKFSGEKHLKVEKKNQHQNELHYIHIDVIEITLTHVHWMIKHAR